MDINSLLLIKNPQYVHCTYISTSNLLYLHMHDCVRIELTILAFHTVHILQVPSSYLPPPSWPPVSPPRDRTGRDRGPPITRIRARGTTLPSHSRETAGTRCRISQPGAGHLENQNLDMILLDM